MQQNQTRPTRKSCALMRTLHRYLRINLSNQFLAHCDFCCLLITLANSLNPNQDQHFVFSDMDTDVNNKGVDQTVARGDFCRLLITLENSFIFVKMAWFLSIYML